MHLPVLSAKPDYSHPLQHSRLDSLACRYLVYPLYNPVPRMRSAGAEGRYAGCLILRISVPIPVYLSELCQSYPVSRSGQ